MKTKTDFLLLILGVFCFAFGVQVLTAQKIPSDATQDEPILSGSDQKIEDSVLKANAVFVGKIIQIGSGSTKEAGQAAYHGVQVKVLQVLRGSVDAQITVTLYAIYTASEQSPKVGGTYIFFAHKNTEQGWDNYTVLKLLPATDDNITKIKKIIATASAAKAVPAASTAK